MLVRVESDGRFFEVSYREGAKTFEDSTLIHYVGMTTRPGVKNCAETLEYSHYSPGTDKNADLTVHVLNWEGIKWLIVSIPYDDRGLMKRCASACGLRVADGIPHLLTAQGARPFPFANDRIFTLENTPNHPVYKNRRH